MQTHAAIEMFTGSALNAQTIHDNINHPRNALNLQGDADDSMDKHLAWGIEAISSDGQVSFFLFLLRSWIHISLSTSTITELFDRIGCHLLYGCGTAMKYILGQALVVVLFHSTTQRSANFTWQSVECLTPAEPLKNLINFLMMKMIIDFKSLSTLVVCLYLMMYWCASLRC